MYFVGLLRIPTLKVMNSKFTSRHKYLTSVGIVLISLDETRRTLRDLPKDNA